MKNAQTDLPNYGASCDRCEKLALYMIDNGATVRSTAAYFGISKSTVHKDLTFVLPKVNKPLYLLVKKVLDANKADRHFRGGEATRQKYLELKVAGELENRKTTKKQ